jgi:hypothetical protein
MDMASTLYRMIPLEFALEFRSFGLVLHATGKEHEGGGLDEHVPVVEVGLGGRLVATRSRCRCFVGGCGRPMPTRKARSGPIGPASAVQG